MPISGMGAPQCGQGKVSSGAAASSSATWPHPPTPRRRVEGGRNVLSAGRAGAVAQAGKQHAQIGIDIGGGAHRGARAVVGEMLVHADRRRQPADRVDRRFRQPKGNHAERFHVLALALFMQDIEPEGRFARTGQPGQDDELVLGDREGDIFQIMQPSAANRDLIGAVIGTSRVDNREEQRRRVCRLQFIL